ALDNLPSDGSPQVAPEGFLDLRAEPLVAQRQRYLLEQIVPALPPLTPGGLPKGSHDLVGVELFYRAWSFVCMGGDGFDPVTILILASGFGLPSVLWLVTCGCLVIIVAKEGCLCGLFRTGTPTFAAARSLPLTLLVM